MLTLCVVLTTAGALMCYADSRIACSTDTNIVGAMSKLPGATIRVCTADEVVGVPRKELPPQ